jgi:hypothetical protein
MTKLIPELRIRKRWLCGVGKTHAVDHISVVCIVMQSPIAASTSIAQPSRPQVNHEIAYCSYQKNKKQGATLFLIAQLIILRTHASPLASLAVPILTIHPLLLFFFTLPPRPYRPSAVHHGGSTGRQSKLERFHSTGEWLKRQERFPVEVISMILGYADRTAILSCLRVSRHHHALAIQRVDAVYNHVFIDRDSIDSVFDCIDWELVEKGWKGIIDRTTSQFEKEEVWDAEEEAGGEPKYLASSLFDPLPRPEQPPTPSASDSEQPSTTSQTDTSTVRLVGLPYDSSRLGQHLRKRHCLSLCRTLTLGDAWYIDPERDARFHTHGVLDNGRAHHLFQDVDTLRTINPSITESNPSGLYQCKTGDQCPFMLELRPKKIVHRNVHTDARHEVAKIANETKVVVFLPCHVWPADPRDLAFPLEFVTTDMTLVFGPWARKTSHTAFWAAMEPWSTSTTWYNYRRLRLVVMEAISSAAARRGGSLRVVGLERTQVLDDRENPRVWVSGYANN